MSDRPAPAALGGDTPRPTDVGLSTPPSRADATRIVLRPIASPLPLGFLALAVATTAFASIQLAWISQAQGHTVALGVLALTVPMQLLAAVMGFLARDPVAATGMGILSGTWAAACLATLTSPPGASSGGLGVVLLASAACLLVPAAAARSKVVPALVILTSAIRFAVTGIAEIDGGHAWTQAAGWIGIALAALSGYAALALELEGSESRTVLPLGRTGVSKKAVDGNLSDQLAPLASEPGVRQQL
jgi:succinate-acetate transporter protein